jgi:hypothetical protein
MLDTIRIGFSVLAVVWMSEFILLNFLYPARFRIPGDLTIKLGGFNLYLPFVSAIVISIAANIFFNFFRK